MMVVVEYAGGEPLDRLTGEPMAIGLLLQLAVAPSYVTEPTGCGVQDNPEAMEDARAYVRNLASWLS